MGCVFLQIYIESHSHDTQKSTRINVRNNDDHIIKWALLIQQLCTFNLHKHLPFSPGANNQRENVNSIHVIVLTNDKTVRTKIITEPVCHTVEPNILADSAKVVVGIRRKYRFCFLLRHFGPV